MTVSPPTDETAAGRSWEGAAAAARSIDARERTPCQRSGLVRAAGCIFVIGWRQRGAALPALWLSLCGWLRVCARMEAARGSVASAGLVSPAAQRPAPRQGLQHGRPEEGDRHQCSPMWGNGERFPHAHRSASPCAPAGPLVLCQKPPPWPPPGAVLGPASPGKGAHRALSLFKMQGGEVDQQGCLKRGAGAHRARSRGRARRTLPSPVRVAGSCSVQWTKESSRGRRSAGQRDSSTHEGAASLDRDVQPLLARVRHQAAEVVCKPVTRSVSCVCCQLGAGCWVLRVGCLEHE